SPGKAQNEAEAKQKIALVKAQLDSGEDFSSIASRYSEDEDTRPKGGDLGSVAESELQRTDAATRQAILNLKPGSVSQPIAIADQSGRPVAYRIVKLSAKDAPGQRDLKDPAVQQWIRKQLAARQEELLKASYEAMLHNGVDIHNYYAESVLRQYTSK